MSEGVGLFVAVAVGVGVGVGAETIVRVRQSELASRPKEASATSPAANAILTTSRYASHEESTFDS